MLFLSRVLLQRGDEENKSSGRSNNMDKRPPMYSALMTCPVESLDTWFKREILSHEDVLVRFISRIWPRHDEIADIRQDAYVRVYEAARNMRPQAPKAFLFATTRHLMADRVRHERIVPIRAAGDSEFFSALVEEISPEQRVNGYQELARLAHAFDRLGTKCREVVWLRRVRGLSQKEVADRLGLAEKTVEKHLRTGARMLARYTRDNALVHVMNDADGSDNQDDQVHGAHKRY
jgi:RNA polymerase sigma-70 factor (ECF subfamily)